jgi:hypothetical protein
MREKDRLERGCDMPPVERSKEKEPRENTRESEAFGEAIYAI